MVVESGRLRDSLALSNRAVRESVLLESLVAELYPWARSVAYVLCRNAHEADDLVQDALVRLVRRPPDPLNREVVRAWLRTGMFRLFVRRSHRIAREVQALQRIARDTPREIHLSTGTTEVLSALAGLSPRQRACVVLRYLEDLSEAEVARTLGTRLGTVKAHLAQARTRLREMLGEPVPVAD